MIKKTLLVSLLIVSSSVLADTTCNDLADATRAVVSKYRDKNPTDLLKFSNQLHDTRALIFKRYEAGNTTSAKELETVVFGYEIGLEMLENTGTTEVPDKFIQNSWVRAYSLCRGFISLLH